MRPERVITEKLVSSCSEDSLSSDGGHAARICVVYNRILPRLGKRDAWRQKRFADGKRYHIHTGYSKDGAIFLEKAEKHGNSSIVRGDRSGR